MLTSYAQNFEDIVLWRALGKVTAGFYIDLGASDPIGDSVTKLFYDHGWRGINVEPAVGPFNSLNRERPRDINIQCLVSAQAGSKTFFIVGDDSGLSTTEKAFAQRHEAAGWAIQERVVETRTLASICEEHVVGEIHFLKIDVEGEEEAALAGADFARFRPWIILIEATLPNSQIPSHEAWESGLLKQGYLLVYFDGLNRFYAAQERATELRRYFTTPPNVFDNFERVREKRLRDRVAALEAQKSPMHCVTASVAEVLSLYVAAMVPIGTIGPSAMAFNLASFTLSSAKGTAHSLRVTVRVALDSYGIKQLEALATHAATIPSVILTRALDRGGGVLSIVETITLSNALASGYEVTANVVSVTFIAQPATAPKSDSPAAQ